MLSLSIFSSSQRISVALYEEQKLKEFIETKIKSNKIDSVFLLLKKILVGKGRKISKIFFSVGPGSFTAIRSIQAIAQGISVASNAKIITITDFEIYLANLSRLKKNAAVFFETFNGYFFYQYFTLKKQKFLPKNKFYKGSTTDVLNFIVNNEANKDSLVITTNKKNFNFPKKFDKYEIVVCKPCAKKIAVAVFEGYGQMKQDIIYHHTYYE